MAISRAITGFIGARFGRLVVEEELGLQRRHEKYIRRSTYWVCLCD